MSLNTGPVWPEIQGDIIKLSCDLFGNLSKIISPLGISIAFFQGISHMANWDLFVWNKMNYVHLYKVEHKIATVSTIEAF